MGNALKSAKEKLTLDQFKEYLNLLKGVTYKLLLKRHIDVAFEMHEKIHRDDIDYLDGNTAGAVLANIRFKNTNDILGLYAGTMPSVSEYNCDVVLSNEVMDTNPRFWTIGQLVAAMKELEKCRIEYFGQESVAEAPQTSAEKRAATVQATLAVFKSVFSQLPEQTAPPSGADSDTNPPDTLPPECMMSSNRLKRDVEDNMGDVLARIHAGYAQNKTFDQIAYEIYRERKLKKAAEAKLSSPMPRESSVSIKIETEKENKPVTESSSEGNKTPTGTKSRKKSKKLSTKNKLEKPITNDDNKSLETTSLSNPLLGMDTAENVENEPKTEKNNANTASSLSLDIPLTMESKPTLIFSDSLSEAFLPNPVSVLTRTGKVAGTPNKSDSLDDIKSLDFSQNIDTSDPEIIEEFDDDPSEPDEPEPVLE